MAASLLDHLQEQGYEPQDVSATDGPAENWFDLVVSGTGTVRVIVDDGSVDVYLFDAFMACEWNVSLSSAPDSTILAVIKDAEWQLAAALGG